MKLYPRSPACMPPFRYSLTLSSLPPSPSLPLCLPPSLPPSPARPLAPSLSLSPSLLYIVSPQLDLLFTILFSLELMVNLFAHWFLPFVTNPWSRLPPTCPPLHCPPLPFVTQPPSAPTAHRLISSLPSSRRRAQSDRAPPRACVRAGRPPAPDTSAPRVSPAPRPPPPPRDGAPCPSPVAAARHEFDCAPV